MDRDLVSRVIAGKVVLDHVKQGMDELKADVTLQMQVGDRLTGTADGLNLGAVTKCRGRVSAFVVDERAFVDWVEQNYPTEVERVVRPVTRDKILRAVANGERDEVPGVQVREGQPYLRVTPSEEGQQWVLGKLSGIREITG